MADGPRLMSTRTTRVVGDQINFFFYKQALTERSTRVPVITVTAVRVPDRPGRRFFAWGIGQQRQRP